MKVYHDQHIHTRFSEDSKAWISGYLRKAKKAGVEYFITCEHVDFSPVSYKSDWIADFSKLYKLLDKKHTNIKMLHGIELGYRKDQLERMNKILASFRFDLVQLSCHDNGIVDFYHKEAFKEYPEDLDTYFDYVIDAVTTFDNFDVLSHFDYGLRSALEAKSDIDIKSHIEKIKKIFEIVIKKGKALEINTKTQQKINNDEYLMNMLKLYKSMGGTMLTLSSDAHMVSQYRCGFDKYMKMIKDAGFDCLYYFVDRVPKKYYLE